MQTFNWIYAAKRYKIFITWWWSEAVSGVSRLCDHGYTWMPTPLPWNTGVLWRFKYESRAASSFTLGWETSIKWSHGGRKECKSSALVYDEFAFTSCSLVLLSF